MTKILGNKGNFHHLIKGISVKLTSDIIPNRERLKALLSCIRNICIRTYLLSPLPFNILEILDNPMRQENEIKDTEIGNK